MEQIITTAAPWPAQQYLSFIASIAMLAIFFAEAAISKNLLAYLKYSATPIFIAYAINSIWMPFPTLMIFLACIGNTHYAHSRISNYITTKNIDWSYARSLGVMWTTYIVIITTSWSILYFNNMYFILKGNTSFTWGVIGYFSLWILVIAGIFIFEKLFLSKQSSSKKS